MSEILPELRHDRHLALEGRGREPWVRRAVLALLLAVVIAGAVGAAGQSAHDRAAAGPAAALTVRAPHTLRAGLMAQGRITVEAKRPIDHPELVLGTGWTEGIQINTVVPEAAEQQPEGDRVVLAYDALDRGDKLVVRLQLQVDPTNLGRRSQQVVLRDGRDVLATTGGTLTVLP